MPKAATPAREPLAGLPPSSALSIERNPPQTFAGRKVGALVTDGVDRPTLEELRAALETEGAMLELIAPSIGGVTASDGTLLPVQHKLGGGPSVLFDAVAVMPSADGSRELLQSAAARDFVAGAFGHLKFIAYTARALPLLEKAGIAADLDEGCIKLSKLGAPAFVIRCRQLRLWAREGVAKP